MWENVAFFIQRTVVIGHFVQHNGELNTSSIAYYLAHITARAPFGIYEESVFTMRLVHLNKFQATLCVSSRLALCYTFCSLADNECIFFLWAHKSVVIEVLSLDI